MKKRYALAAALLLSFWAMSDARATSINFDEAALNHLDDITSFYAGLGVTFNGISNPFPIGPGPFPAPATVPATLGGAAIWDPGGATAPGESPENFAVGLGQGEPGDGGILMTFSFDLLSLSVVGLDFGNTATDTEEMTLTAYDATGALLGQQHWTAQFANGAILGSIAFPGMRYVAFNYTNTDFGFYGIDNLEFERAPDVTPEPSGLFVLGLGLAALAVRRKRKIRRHDGPLA